MDETHWTKVPTNNKFLCRPSATMLTEQGYRLLKRIGARGVERIDHVVHYDRDYVIGYLATNLQGLRSLPDTDACALLTEALEIARNNADEG